MDQRLRMTPIPPAGPLRIVVGCPDLGVAEAGSTVDATPLVAPAADVVTLSGLLTWGGLVERPVGA